MPELLKIADAVAGGSMRELRSQVTGEFAAINRYTTVTVHDICSLIFDFLFTDLIGDIASIGSVTLCCISCVVKASIRC